MYTCNKLHYYYLHNSRLHANNAVGLTKALLHRVVQYRSALKQRPKGSAPSASSASSRGASGVGRTRSGSNPPRIPATRPDDGDLGM